MRIYLDNCCLQRPLDDQTQPRIRVEAEAVLAVLTAVQAEDVVLLNSEALEFEMARIPDERRRKEAVSVLALAKERLEITEAVEALAESLGSRGFGPLDAVHLALASTAKADIFATCDDRLLRKAQAETGIACRIVSILDLVAEILK